jgi:glyoxylase-like metal-dependent hydrolase (beta-lactamase superfamily II)
MGSLTAFICTACGTQFAQSAEPPAACAICQDARQYIPPSGQNWTTLEKLRASHRNCFRQYEPNLFGIGTTPEFAIGQRALLLRTSEGNVLWDCISLLDDATIAIIRALGGLRGIAISHPHYYATMLEWSRAFDDAPIYLHAEDREWVMRPDAAIEFWEGQQKEIADGLTLIRCGGHFAGGTVLHWAVGADERGALLSGDVVAVGPDGFVSFMYSYPNMIPLPARSIQEIEQALEPFAYDRIYGAFWERKVDRDARSVLAGSVRRYLSAIGDPTARQS